ncbi:NAD(P)-dependent dehydrogenase, short-chain alcohol dehydrogenase family [Nonomuraea solani]|uniref:NAD(P)-dependent dehydrogenase, short-chain alcohol dehydrogenase family n=1 Tax=Nonomuraea solani TaxID=1144553 RepID=A0A1H6ESQ7_9ACTN|nr:SDR family oxidoreductase [Nonomuraea solani]SEG99734.1 NAD(P)-dependent dehydrogenase, short-chain alcohol dehydrogenase family [Nonomuraea solani]
MSMTTLAPMPTASPLPAALEGRTVMVVGGSSGIGLAAGALLAAVGARVTLVARDQGRLTAAVDRIRAESGGSVLGITGDSADEDDLGRAFDQVGTVDHVLVTAGGFGTGALLDTPREQVREAVDSRIWGAYAVARTAGRRLPAGGSITFSSGLYLTRPIPGASSAIASLGAVEGLTRALAVELAPRRLRVNAIRYGIVDTPLSRGAMGLADDMAVAAAGQGSLIGRFGTAEEAASAALFVMANHYMTGTVLTVDGGQSLV